ADAIRERDLARAARQLRRIELDRPADVVRAHALRANQSSVHMADAALLLDLERDAHVAVAEELDPGGRHVVRETFELRRQHRELHASVRGRTLRATVVARLDAGFVEALHGETLRGR